LKQIRKIIRLDVKNELLFIRVQFSVNLISTFKVAVRKTNKYRFLGLSCI